MRALRALRARAIFKYFGFMDLSQQSKGPCGKGPRTLTEKRQNASGTGFLGWYGPHSTQLGENS